MNQLSTLLNSEAQAPASQPDYHSFLLRMWLVPDGLEVKWRASLEDVQSGELKGFIELGDLLEHLEGLTEPSQGQEAGSGSPAPDGEEGARPS